MYLSGYSDELKRVQNNHLVRKRVQKKGFKKKVREING